MMVRRKGDWMAAQIGEELVMMSADQGNYIGLSAVGTRVWELLEAPQDFDDLCARLVGEFDVAPEICRAEVEAFLQALAKQGAVTFDPPPATA